MKTRYT